jgi:class 3 adenylate cyclase
MKRFSFKTTQARIALLIGVLALAAALNAVITINIAANSQERVTILQGYTSAAQQNDNARASLLNAKLALKNILISPQERAKDYGDYDQYVGQFAEYLIYQELNDTESAAVQELIAQSDKLDQQLEKFSDKLWGDNPDEDELARMELDELDPAFAAVDGKVQALLIRDVQAMRAQLADIEKSNRWVMISGQVALLVLVLLVVWGAYTTLKITTPLENLNGAIVAFENSTYTPELLAEDVKRPDDLGKLARAVGGMAQSITAANRLKEQFLQAAQRFIPTQYLEFLEKENITKVQLGDHVSAEMAVMFSDIRGFSTLSEKMTAQQNFDFVNEYLKMVSPIVQQNEGFIVKFLGDGMMAIFPYGVANAVQAGIQKAARVQQFNQMLNARGLPSIAVGIGIHTGPMMVGMIGEELRMQGDAFSDHVNLTSRIEGLNKFFGTSLLISEDTLQQLPQPVSFKLRFLGRVVVKGRVSALGIYEVLDGLPAQALARRQAAQADFARGLELYARGRFNEAGQAFNRAHQADPEDKTAKFYLESCAEWLNRPLPAGWDGAIVMEGK